MNERDAERLVVCPDCRGSGRDAGFSSKAGGVWEPPLCVRCDGRGDLFVTVSGDSEHVYLNDENGRIVGRFTTLDSALAATHGAGEASQ